MDLALNIIQKLICHKTQTTQPARDDELKINSKEFPIDALWISNRKKNVPL